MPEKNKISVPCPFCRSPRYRIKYHQTRKDDIPTNQHDFCCTCEELGKHGEIVECSQCKLCYNLRQYDPAVLNAYYENVIDPQYLDEREGRYRTFGESIKHLHRWRSGKGNLLDVGCYTGAFMEVAAKHGWDVQGTEISRWASGISKKLKVGEVYQGDISETPIQKSSLDVVTMWDVIEHVSDPVSLLKTIHGFLKTGGVLAMSTYMIDSIPVRILGKRYPFFMEMHLVHFSRHTIKKMLRQCQFEVLEIRKHKRILRLQYVMERFRWIVPFLNYLNRFGFFKKLTNRHISISNVGIYNIFARAVDREPGEGVSG